MRPNVPGLPLLHGLTDPELVPQDMRSIAVVMENLRELLASSLVYSMFLGGSGLTLAGGSTTFLGLSGTFDATEANVRVKAPRRLTLGDLKVRATPAPGASQSYTVTVRLGGVNTPLAVVVSGTNTEGENTMAEVLVEPDTLVSIGIVASAGAATLTAIQIGLNAGLHVL